MPNELIKPEIEAALIDIWSAVLERPGVPANAEFLDLGGDSLSAMMCISRTRKLLHYELSIEDFFMDGATINNIAEKIADGLTSAP
jgi:acyl carrier protein